MWFEKSAAELWQHCRPTNWTGPEATAKSADTLDVWIDSGSSSRAVLMRRAELQHSTLNSQPSTSPATVDETRARMARHRLRAITAVLVAVVALIAGVAGARHRRRPHRIESNA